MLPASSHANTSRSIDCVPFRDGASESRLRGTRSAPERGDLDPGAIRGVLADTFVLDFDASRGFPFRIAGSRANALFLKELRGLSFLALWRDADREELGSIIHSI